MLGSWCPPIRGATLGYYSIMNFLYLYGGPHSSGVVYGVLRTEYLVRNLLVMALLYGCATWTPRGTDEVLAAFEQGYLDVRSRGKVLHALRIQLPSISAAGVHQLLT
jgi:hypothetical protein